MLDPNRSGRVIPPFSDSEISSINAYQAARLAHPMTCGIDSRHHTLVATTSGLECPDPGCTYRQRWAPAFLADWSWRPDDNARRLGSILVDVGTFTMSGMRFGAMGLGRLSDRRAVLVAVAGEERAVFMVDNPDLLAGIIMWFDARGLEHAGARALVRHALGMEEDT